MPLRFNNAITKLADSASAFQLFYYFFFIMKVLSKQFVVTKNVHQNWLKKNRTLDTLFERIRRGGFLETVSSKNKNKILFFPSEATYNARRAIILKKILHLDEVRFEKIWELFDRLELLIEQ
jgi:hypothetical protein